MYADGGVDGGAAVVRAEAAKRVVRMADRMVAEVW
jgi:hypothetical protein